MRRTETPRSGITKVGNPSQYRHDCDASSGPKSAPPLHIHQHTDEVYFILEGGAQVVIGAETITAGTGAFVFVPRGTPHTFANPNDTPARMLLVLTPAGFEQYFVELFALLSQGSNREEYLEKMRAIVAKYDQGPVGEAAGH